MRVGSNPHRQDRANDLMPIVFGVVTHLPILKGYHEYRLEVVQTCLRSMKRNCGLKERDYTLAIWDNGSCSELTDWIEDEIRPDMLIKSINVGKTAARTSLFRMFASETVVCYSDDDMYFHPGWLQPQLDLLTGFPNVACVSGYPVRTAFRWGTEHTMKWARKNAEIQTGRFIPREWEDDFCRSIGRDPAWHESYSAADQDYRATYNGLEAYLTSHHCQFIAKARVVGDMQRYDHMAMGDEKPFDVAMDKIGLRLATTQRYAQHIGNRLEVAHTMTEAPSYITG